MEMNFWIYFAGGICILGLWYIISEYVKYQQKLKKIVKINKNEYLDL